MCSIYSVMKKVAGYFPAELGLFRIRYYLVTNLIRPE